MKNNLLKLTLTICLISLIGGYAKGQEAQKKNEIKIRVEKNVNGKTIIQERVIDTTNMSDVERELAIAKAQEELMGKSKKGVKVITEGEIEESIFEEKEGRFEWRSDDDEDVEIFFDGENDRDVRVYKFKGNKPKVIIKKRGGRSDDFEWNSENWEDDFERSMNSLNNGLRYLGEEIPRRIERTPLYLWDNEFFGGKSTPIRSVDVYSNRPDSHIINVRFIAPNEGDVIIKVLNIDGKIVARENVNNFKGEYVGQIELKKNSKGTFFVIISQEEDGISKRIILD